MNVVYEINRYWVTENVTIINKHFSRFLTIFSSRIESYLVTALVFNVKEMMRFDSFGMRSISVACKILSIDRQSVEAHNSTKLYICWKKKVYQLVLRSSMGLQFRANLNLPSRLTSHAYR